MSGGKVFIQKEKNVPLVQILLNDLCFRSEIALLHYKNLQQILLKKLKAEDDYGKLDVFGQREHAKKSGEQNKLIRMALYGIITSAAQISSIIKPTNNRRKRPHETSQELAQRKAITTERGQIIRKILDIPENHGILDRTLRNRILHTDEDIDDWWYDCNGNAPHFSFILGPYEALGGDNSYPTVVEDLGRKDIFEHFDPETLIFTYRGEGFQIHEVINQINELMNRIKCAEAVFTGHGLEKPMSGGLEIVRRTRI